MRPSKIILFSQLLAVVMMILVGCGAPTPAKPGEQTGSSSNNESMNSSSGNSTRASSGSELSTDLSGIKDITVAANGGKIERAIRDVIGPKFKEKTGISINFIAGLSGEILSKVELQKNAPQIDVAFYVPLDVKRAQDKGLVEEIGSTHIPNYAHLDQRFIAVDGVGAPVFGLTIAPLYNTEIFAKNGWKAPESWNDLINAQYGGKTVIADIGNDWGFTVLYNLALANGGSLDDLTPGLEKAKELARFSNTFYKNSTQMMPAFQQGEGVIGVMGSYATADLAVSGLPVKMIVPKEGAPLQAFSATIVKGTPKKAAAEAFIDYLLSDEAQTLIAKEAFYPVVQGVSIDPQYVDIIGYTKDDPLYRPDILKLAEIRSTWVDRWNQEVIPQLGKGVK